MDANKTGAFIAEMRKKNGLTQKELAKKLLVSDKTVSRWETGKGYPEIEVLPYLSKVLGVSINEILNGECIDVNISDQDAEDNIISLCDNANSRRYIRNLKISMALIASSVSLFICGATVLTNIISAVEILISFALIILNYKKYTKHYSSNKILTACEIIGMIAFLMFYYFVYFKFNNSGTIDFVFVFCSLVFMLPIIIDGMIIEYQKSK